MPEELFPVWSVGGIQHTNSSSVLRRSTFLSTFPDELEQLWPKSEDFYPLHDHHCKTNHSQGFPVLFLSDGIVLWTPPNARNTQGLVWILLVCTWRKYGTTDKWGPGSRLLWNCCRPRARDNVKDGWCPEFLRDCTGRSQTQWGELCQHPQWFLGGRSYYCHTCPLYPDRKI